MPTGLCEGHQTFEVTEATPAGRPSAAVTSLKEHACRAKPLILLADWDFRGKRVGGLRHEGGTCSHRSSLVPPASVYNVSGDTTTSIHLDASMP